MRCSVYFCNSNNLIDKSLRFYCFPKDATLLKQWVHFCKRKDSINPKFARICNKHFTSEDFVRNLQFEMGLCKQNGFKLKPGTVPSINRTSNTAVLANYPSARSARAKVRGDKIVIQSLLKESDDDKIVIQSLLKGSDVADKIAPNELNEPSVERNETQEITGELKKKIDTLTVENFKLQNINQINDDKIKSLELQLKKSEYERTNIESKLREIFSTGQIKKLKQGTKRMNWTEDDIARSITLYSASAKAYILLRKKMFPLPSVRTLQWWAKKYNINRKEN